MIKNPENKLYVGVTKNPEKRIIYHNSKRGAEFTKVKHNFRIVFLEKYLTLTQARKREIQIKKWRREKKEMLINIFRQGFKTRLK